MIGTRETAWDHPGADLKTIEAFLYREALLLDRWALEEWSALFTPDGVYWLPIDDEADVRTNVSLVRDTPARREERVYHLLHNSFPAQSPRSRTLHFISNVLVTGRADLEITVTSSQLTYEMRTGDYSQLGLGEMRPLVAQVEHRLRIGEGGLRIAQKKVLLLNRDSWHGNLTFVF
ncbi:aromatic-ring-hydroxylating dioxygenase subunit beta [Ramlibacter sp. AW1]|uniref:Aromatic-ring-hydroxylating dioxygenase subunit beta n=1 Tax=Ramlibacter aurantiacus TaxID=2801330 RepID=A0A936ZG44_9BURK|nr:aromatic-ring-hydroxylating dioxygenase subunit beta [Ramlibacter aurantiacus]MBL0420297.1 aromatic-ring-hydroxylating dioxygenase subunit beta [Ramlibacter aurantiacus]